MGSTVSIPVRETNSLKNFEMKIMYKFLVLNTFAQILAKQKVGIMCLKEKNFEALMDSKCQYLKEKIDSYKSQRFQRINNKNCRLVISRSIRRNIDLFSALKRLNTDSGCENYNPVKDNVLKVLNGYGCYCSLSDGMHTGYGKPVDDVDSLCYETYHNYACLHYDHDSGDSSCHDKTGYFVAMSSLPGHDLAESINGFTKYCKAYNLIRARKFRWTREDY